jgi:O-methyltransferase
MFSPKRLLQSLFLASPLARPRACELLEKAIWSARFRDWTAAHPCPESKWRPAIYHDSAADLGLADAPIDYLEFGVFEGRTLRWWSEINRHPGTRFFGFDTFTGLPEDWDRGGLKAGAFSTEAKTPAIDDARIQYFAGTFQQTLPGFLKSYAGENRRVFHLDADLYSSTLFVLHHLAPFLRTGDVLIFDEFHVYLDEFKALQDFRSAWPLKVRTVRRSPDWAQTVMEIL